VTTVDPLEEQFRRAPDALWDAQSLWPHNHHLIEDEQIEQAVLRGIGFQSITLEERQLDHVWPQPRLVDSVDRDICMPLLDVMVNGDLSPLDGPCCGRCDNTDECRPRCGRCLGAPAMHRLLVPAGGSVVMVNCCAVCKEYISADFKPVVWS